MGCSRVRVELRHLPSNASSFDREIAFKKMFSTFKKQVADAGVLHDFKKHEFYESPGEKRKRKRKEAKNQRLKQNLRESFPEKRRTRGAKND